MASWSSPGVIPPTCSADTPALTNRAAAPCCATRFRQRRRSDAPPQCVANGPRHRRRAPVCSWPAPKSASSQSPKLRCPCAVPSRSLILNNGSHPTLTSIFGLHCTAALCFLFANIGFTLGDQTMSYRQPRAIGFCALFLLVPLPAQALPSDARKDQGILTLQNAAASEPRLAGVQLLLDKDSAQKLIYISPANTLSKSCRLTT